MADTGTLWGEPDAPLCMGLRERTFKQKAGRSSISWLRLTCSLGLLASWALVSPHMDRVFVGLADAGPTGGLSLRQLEASFWRQGPTHGCVSCWAPALGIL